MIDWYRCGRIHRLIQMWTDTQTDTDVDGYTDWYRCGWTHRLIQMWTDRQTYLQPWGWQFLKLVVSESAAWQLHDQSVQVSHLNCYGGNVQNVDVHGPEFSASCPTLCGSLVSVWIQVRPHSACNHIEDYVDFQALLVFTPCSIAGWHQCVYLNVSLSPWRGRQHIPLEWWCLCRILQC